MKRIDFALLPLSSTAVTFARRPEGTTAAGSGVRLRDIQASAMSGIVTLVLAVGATGGVSHRRDYDALNPLLVGGTVEVSTLPVREVDEGAFRRGVEVERRWFEVNKTSLMPRLEGRYVAVQGGRVADSDKDLTDLVDRFFSKRGTVSVYFGYIGDEPTFGVGASSGSE